MLQKHAPAIFSVIVFFLLCFRPYTNQICMRSRFDPLSRAFSNRCVFDENAQRISVNGRPKRIKMYAFSNENALGRRGLINKKFWFSKASHATRIVTCVMRNRVRIILLVVFQYSSVWLWFSLLWVWRNASVDWLKNLPPLWRQSREKWKLILIRTRFSFLAQVTCFLFEFRLVRFIACFSSDWRASGIKEPT